MDMDKSYGFMWSKMMLLIDIQASKCSDWIMFSSDLVVAWGPSGKGNDSEFGEGDESLR